ncbi:MAG: hypothetical protein DHS20C12_18660 [Pseudohongiella sp.]|nr:MAG: hypothetical protein DHS20C12_18660 [Pseudohongiella sp.]
MAEATTDAASASGTGSFRMGNGEIRDEFIQMMTDADIEFWLGDNGIINYNLSDADAIDRIGNEVISEYITRN